MDPTPRAYRAICFDLDGTLLPMDLDVFMGRYFAALYDFMEARGIEGGPFLEALKAGTTTFGDFYSPMSAPTPRPSGTPSPTL